MTTIKSTTNCPTCGNEVKVIAGKSGGHVCVPKQQKFKMPTDKQLIQIAIIFNNGGLDPNKLADMVAMSQFVVDRLYENGDVMVPSKKENQDNG